MCLCCKRRTSATKDEESELIKKEAVGKDGFKKLTAKEQLAFLWRYQQNEWRSLLLGLVYLIFGQAADFLTPWYLGLAVDKIERG